jgi:ribosomal protein S18 acetylase RimI-like enzyme
VDPVVVNDLQPDDVPVARRIIATAFAGEPFAVGMFGDSPLARFVGMHEQYRSWPWDPSPVAVVARAGREVVGVAQGTRPGHCHLCDTYDESVRHPESRADRIEHEFQLECRRAHLRADLPAHGHISVVATEPFIHGSGAGRLLVAALLDRLRSAGARCVVLECLSSRQAFYGACGFGRLDDFDDPGAPGLRSVLMSA